VRLKVLIGFVTFVMLLGGAKGKETPPSSADTARSLMARVGPPSQQAVDNFMRAGMREVRPHSLTAVEREKVEATLASLPALHRETLRKRLHILAFVDGIPGDGTGLTEEFEKTGLYDITLRSSIIQESLTAFLTTKERKVFAPDGSGISIIVHATGADALTYVLLHESTHVVDVSNGVTATPANRYDDGIWTGPSALVPRLASSLAVSNIFRGGHPIPAARAVAVYEALSHTPFVSLYATANANEDFAELVSWHELLLQHHGYLDIEVDDADGKALKDYKPLSFPEVKGRFDSVVEFLGS
jgi:hypothetical protein